MKDRNPSASTSSSSNNKSKSKIEKLTLKPTGKASRDTVSALPMGMSKETARECAAIMKAVGHPIRVMVVHALQHQEYCECDLLPMCRVTQPTLTRHLAVLKKAGLLTERQAGARKFLGLDTRAAKAPFARMQDIVLKGAGR